MRFHFLLMLPVLALAACSGDEPAPAAQAPAAAAAGSSTAGAVAATNAGTVEVACASCVYKMDGVSGCHLATMVDGKPMLVTGVPTPGHDSGLCEGAKQASMAGQVVDGQYVATSFALKP